MGTDRQTVRYLVIAPQVIVQSGRRWTWRFWLPAPLHRLVYRIAYRLRKQWRARISGHARVCRIVALDADAGVLLVRHSFGSSKWSLPCGGMKRGEGALDAAERELREEAGCGLRNAAQIMVFEERVGRTVFRVHVVAGGVDGRHRPDRREVTDVRFFAPDLLPDDRFEGIGELVRASLAQCSWKDRQKLSSSGSTA